MTGAAPEGLIWATRGRSWGFRFLLDAGLADPLAAYERAFADVPEEPTAWHRTPDAVALRFPDPDGRVDAAGRLIPHEFVVLGPPAERLDTFEAGRRHVWSVIGPAYRRVWDAKSPPTASDLEFGVQI